MEKGRLARLVSSNPLAFYSLMDLACRTHTSMELSDLLRLGVLVDCKNFLGNEWQELFSTKQHIKAYTSAMASWVKAFIIRLPPVMAAAATEASEGCGDLQLMVSWVQDVLYSLQPIQNIQRCRLASLVPNLRAEMASLELLADLSCSSSNFDIMVLVWVSRAVEAMSEQLLKCIQQRATVAASSSTTQSNPNGKQDISSSSTMMSDSKGKQDTSSSSSSSTTEFDSKGKQDTSSSSTTESDSKGKQDTSSSSTTESDSKGKQDTSSSCSTMESDSKGKQDTSSSSSTIESDSKGKQDTSSSSTTESDSKGKQDTSSRSSSSGAPGRGGGRSTSDSSRAVQSAIRQTGAFYMKGASGMTAVALSLHKRLSEWHETATAAATGDQQSAATAEHADTASPSSSDPSAASSAGARAQAAAARQLPSSSKFRLPQEGLPAAVVDQLEQLKGRWPFAVRSNGEDVEDEQVQLMVLQDVIGLCKLLQQEVPVPVGCNNPACLNLQGMAEMATGCKTCLGCQVARYCGRECQVGHWKEHKKICKQLQQKGDN